MSVRVTLMILVGCSLASTQGQASDTLPKQLARKAEDSTPWGIDGATPLPPSSPPKTPQREGKGELFEKTSVGCMTELTPTEPSDILQGKRVKPPHS